MLARIVSGGWSRRIQAAGKVPVRAFARATDSTDDDDEGGRRKKSNDDDLGLDLDEIEPAATKKSTGLEEFDEDEPLEPPPLYGHWKDTAKPFRQLAPAAARKHRYQAIAPKNMALARRRLLDEFGARSISFDDPQFVYDESLRPDMGLLYEKDELDKLAKDTEEFSFDEDETLNLEAKGLVRQIIYVDTVQKPVTQGNILTFRALVCVGNQEGAAGYAVGRGGKITDAIERATIRAMNSMVFVDRFDDRTLYHEVRGKFNSCSLFIRPSKFGMGTTVSDTVGCALYCFGINDVVSKCYGQRNPYTVIKATFDALSKHETAEQIAMKTGHSVYEITNLAKHGKIKAASLVTLQTVSRQILNFHLTRCTMADEETNSVADDEPQEMEATPTDNNIKIFLRIKPTKKASGFFTWEEDNNAMEYNIPKDVASGLINNSRTNYKFKFDGLIGMTAKQEEVFDRIGRPCVENALAGFNSTIFAYGQTGSGKTFTITGGAERYEDRGIIPRSLSLIFEKIKKHPECQISAFISYLEIYNNQGYDLLNEDHQNTKAIEDLPKVSMLEDEDGNCHLRNLSMHRVATEEDALNLLFLGDTNRAVSETSMNLESSRSHCIFTVSLESRKAGSEVILRSKLHMVDLAGSERAHKTGAKGKVLKEAAYINTSLHYLEMVIVALHEKNTKGRTHIPYRNSMMTSVLRDSLGGNCKTVMVATASAEKEQTDESLSTCRFAQRVARVRNDAHLNEEVDPAIVIRRLKAQIVELQEEIALLKGAPKEGDELKDYELEKLKQKCLDFANNRDPDAHLAMGELTYTKMKACFGFLKSFYLEGGGSTSNITTSTAPSYSNNNPQAEQRIVELEQTIQQRDNEIAILVGMLKKGGNVQALEALKTIEKPVSKPVAPVAKSGAPIPPPPNPFNIKIDPATLDDPAKAFEVFRDQYPKNDVIRENKQLLKKKYDQAKSLAQKVNDARGLIKEYMAAVEKVRKEKAMQAVASDQEIVVSEEETALVAQIDAKKAEYKTGFNTLNELKKEIQHIQKLLEMSRIKLQKDFDLWYQSQGKGQVLTESLVQKVSQSPSTKSITENKQAPKAAWPPSPRTPDNQTKESVPTTGIQDVDKDVSGFYEALDILKRRNSRK